MATTTVGRGGWGAWGVGHVVAPGGSGVSISSTIRQASRRCQNLFAIANTSTSARRGWGRVGKRERRDVPPGVDPSVHHCALYNWPLWEGAGR